MKKCAYFGRIFLVQDQHDLPSWMHPCMFQKLNESEDFIKDGTNKFR